MQPLDCTQCEYAIETVHLMHVLHLLVQCSQTFNVLTSSETAKIVMRLDSERCIKT